MTILTCASTSVPISLGQQIASSGEGEVWETSLDGYLAKLYYSPNPERVKKLEVMVASPPVDPTLIQGHISIAWPQDLLEDDTGACVGFLMPAIRNSWELPSVYNPRLRQKKAPKFNWFYLHTAAQNVASIIQAIHAKGYVLGDMKPQNLLVNGRALVSVIDTDSFQVCHPQTGRIYHCTVGSEGFTPVELLGKKFSTVIQTEVHDRFRLAVIIYLLLFGNHPFGGRWAGRESPAVDELIRRGLWPYAQSHLIQPGPATIPLYVVHPEIKQCFLRCFNDGYIKPDLRPTAADWFNALQLALGDLKSCDRQANHYYSQISGRCYWCDRTHKLGVDVFATTPRAIAPPAIPSSGVLTTPIRKQFLRPKPLNSLEKAIIAVAIAVLLILAETYWYSQPHPSQILQPTASSPQNQPITQIPPNSEDLQRLITTKTCPGCDLRKANLEGKNLSGANLSAANLSGADLHFTNFERAYLRQANLSGANFSSTYLKGADLEGANLEKAFLGSIDLGETNLRYANLKSAYMKAVELRGANLEGADLRTAAIGNLIGANLRSANLSGVNLDGVDMSRANLKYANLSNADLRGANLLAADLTGADVTGAFYSHSTRFDPDFDSTRRNMQLRE